MANSTGKPRDATTWLVFAAAPIFALMALLSITNASPLALCSAGSRLLPIDGMTAMYLLMTLFHLPPWLKFANRG